MGNCHERFLGEEDMATYASLPDNYNLRDRNNTYRASQEDWTTSYNFPVTHCPLTCCISRNGSSGEVYTQKPDKKTGLLKRRSAGAIQDANLKELKKSRPWYKRVNSTAKSAKCKALRQCV